MQSVSAAAPLSHSGLQPMLVPAWTRPRPRALPVGAIRIVPAAAPTPAPAKPVAPVREAYTSHFHGLGGGFV